MSLDLSQVQPQVQAMASHLAAEGLRRRERAQKALELLRSQASFWEALESKRRSSRITWLAAQPLEALDSCHPLPPAPPEFTVLGSDGSHIQVDRHAPVRCYLINIGTVQLCYGQHPRAALGNQPTLYSREEDLALAEPGGPGEERVQGPLLGAKRAVAEVDALARLAEDSPYPILALLDGSLILWGLEAYPDWARTLLLRDGLVPALDRLRTLAAPGLALASYISLPQSTEVVNLLRLAICPYEVANCDHRCPRGAPRLCQEIAGMEDRAIFGQLLGPGQRSASFGNCSQVVSTYYAGNQVRFFYLKTEGEVARVEFPAWADVNLVHALVWHQVKQGLGYPVALSEAHQQAVVANADRDNFWRLVDECLQSSRLPAGISGKSQSKRHPWL